MTDTSDLLGKWACRFCRHDQYTHNLIHGCTSCDCLATPGEAGPRTDAELDAPILPPGQLRSGHTARRRLSAIHAEEQERLDAGRTAFAATINREDA